MELPRGDVEDQRIREQKVYEDHERSLTVPGRQPPGAEGVSPRCTMHSARPTSWRRSASVSPRSPAASMLASRGMSSARTSACSSPARCARATGRKGIQDFLVHIREPRVAHARGAPVVRQRGRPHDARSHVVQQPEEGIVAVGQAASPGRQPLGRAFHQRQQQHVAIGKLPVERGAAHAGHLHDQVQWGMDAVSGEDAVGDVEQLRPAGSGIQTFCRSCHNPSLSVKAGSGAGRCCSFRPSIETIDALS